MSNLMGEEMNQFQHWQHWQRAGQKEKKRQGERYTAQEMAARCGTSPTRRVQSLL